MSFDMNISSSKPVIREAQSMQNDGGGGNLGYMSQGEKENQQKNPFRDTSIFIKKEESDIFGYEKDFKLSEDEVFSFSNWIVYLINKIKNLFIK